MRGLAFGLSALCFVGSANAATFTYRLDNGETFGVTIDDADFGKTYIECGSHCSAETTGAQFVFQDHLRVEESGSAYTNIYVDVGFIPISWMDFTFEDVMIGVIGIEYGLDFRLNDWRNLTIGEMLSAGGSYTKQTTSFFSEPGVDEFCAINFEFCPHYRAMGKFQITSINGVPTPIPAAGLFLLTGLGGLVAWRRSNHSM